MSPAFTLAVSFLTDFIIAAGGTLTGGMIGQDAIALPSRGVWLTAVIVGLMAGARRAQALLAPSVLR